ncbi:hypothetical protein CYY_000244 [Polysphondylium violaceum]|uniref:Calmodulin-binding protein n=1 Tax=Polysphondylium violaceum TaxID=133409 RepID=A0A8J4VBS5_9MYCE|nr:hypothetical protein CYY_000244 [Polysphondylium violaceum]
MTESFYLIWRNQYTRRLIRNLVCQNLVIKVDKEYLILNHQYLALFTNKDKLDYNIRIRNDNDYLDINNNRHLIDDVQLLLTSDFDFNEIHDGVHTLRLKIINTSDDDLIATGVLPPSLTNLQLINDDRIGCPLAHHILSNLPANLQELELGIYQNTLISPCIIPTSLTDINSRWSNSYQDLKWLVVPPNKVYKSCKVDVDSMESLEWLKENKWITAINIHPNILDILMFQHQLPAHVTKVELEIGIIQDTSFLPQTLQSLTCRYGTTFSHLAHLQVLKITDSYQIKLEKGVLPASLQELYLNNYNHPLEIDVLPPLLTTLSLYEYDRPLCINVLPSSLTQLYLVSFDQPLNAFVLPSKLKTLFMRKFNQPILPRNSLPVSLTKLSLIAFKGSFDQCQPLHNLKRLQIGSLVPSLSTLLANVKRLDLLDVEGYEEDDPSGTCLYNTSLESLHIHFHYYGGVKTLYPNTFPPTLKYLTLVNANLKPDDVIPRGCVLLKSKYL